MLEMMMMMTRSRTLALSCLLHLVLISFASSAIASTKDPGGAAGELLHYDIRAAEKNSRRRDLQEELIVESRFYVTVFVEVRNGVTTVFPDPIQIECGSNAIPVLLEKENFGDEDVECTLMATENKLLCSNLLTKVDISSGVVSEATSFVVACRGGAAANSGDADFDYLKVTLPQSTFSMLQPALGGTVTRVLAIKRICDVPMLDGVSLRNENYYASSIVYFDSVCTASDDTGGGSCLGIHLCSYDGFSQQAGEPCVNEILPEMSQTVASPPPNPSIFACVYSVDRPALPSLDDTYRADYVASFASVATDSSCDFDRGTILVTCENGGILGNTGESSPNCQLVDVSTQSCDVSTIDSAVTEYSCTGSSLEQLAVSVTWTPGDGTSLQCQPSNTFGVAALSRSLNVGQKCPDEVTVARSPTWLGYADDVAVTCYPYASSFPDYITSETINLQTGQTIDADGYAFELCLLSDPVEARLTAMKASILPQHIDLGCLFTVDGGTAGNVANGGGDNDGGGTGAGDSGGQQPGANNNASDSPSSSSARSRMITALCILCLGLASW